VGPLISLGAPSSVPEEGGYDASRPEEIGVTGVEGFRRWWGDCALRCDSACRSEKGVMGVEAAAEDLRRCSAGAILLCCESC